MNNAPAPTPAPAPAPATPAVPEPLAACITGGGIVGGGTGASGYSKRLSSVYSGVISIWKKSCSIAFEAANRD